MLPTVLPSPFVTKSFQAFLVTHSEVVVSHSFQYQVSHSFPYQVSRSLTTMRW